jgi:hypothetical protein
MSNTQIRLKEIRARIDHSGMRYPHFENDVKFLADALENALGALGSVSMDYYKKNGGTSGWPRSALEECIENDTRIAQEAIQSIEEMAK